MGGMTSNHGNHTDGMPSKHSDYMGGLTSNHSNHTGGLISKRSNDVGGMTSHGEQMEGLQRQHASGY